MLSEPLAGWRHVEVTQRRTKKDYASIVKYLVDERYPDAKLITIVQDNLNTHVPSALYETFKPAEAIANPRPTRISLYSQTWQLA